MLARSRLFRLPTVLAAAGLAGTAVGAGPIPAAADSSPPNVTITSYSQWTESTNPAVHLVGEVQNTGGDATVSIDFNLKKADGSSAGSTSELTTTKIVGHNEKSPFEEILNPPPPGYDHFIPTFTSPPSRSVASPAHQFTFALDDCPGQDPNSPACQASLSKDGFTGTVKNGNGVAVDSVRAIFTFYDLSGNVVAQNWTSVTNGTGGSSLGPGDAGTFDLNRAGEKTWSSMSMVAEPDYPLDVNPAPLTFADQLVGTTSPDQEVTLHNHGQTAITVASIVASAQFGTSGTCPTIASGASCRIGVSFSPTATGMQTGTVVITDNAAGSPQTISLSGNGVAPVVSLTPNPAPAFADTQVGSSSAPKTFTLKNTGTAALDISNANAIATTGDFSQVNNCPASLAINASCSIDVTFSPTGSGNLKHGTLTVTDPTTGSHSVALQGTGLGSGVSFDVASVDFGNQGVGTSQTKDVTVTNNGNRPLLIHSITVPPSYSKGGTCPLDPATLSAGASCTIHVTFTPTQPGAANGNLTLSDNAGDTPQSIPVTGTGVSQVVFAPDGLAFGNQLINSASGVKTIQFNNASGSSVTITSKNVTGEYTQTNDCGATVAAGSHCTFSVRFRPVEARDQAGTLTLNTSSGTKTASLTGTGVNPTWDSLGGGLPSDAAVTSSGGVVDVFARGVNNGLWHRSGDGNPAHWGPWESLGGVLTSDPAAASWSPGHIDVFVRGTDNGLWQLTRNSANAQWVWTSLGGGLLNSPGVASWGPGRLDVFVEGGGGQLWQRTFDASIDANNWQPWQPLGGVLTAEPAAVSSKVGRIDVFVKGTNNGLWQLTYDHGAWAQQWAFPGGGLSSAPSAASVGPDRLDVFVQGGNGALWDWTNSNGGTWINDSALAGGVITSDPAAAARSDGSGIVDVIARGTDNAVWHLALGRLNG